MKKIKLAVYKINSHESRSYTFPPKKYNGNKKDPIYSRKKSQSNKNPHISYSGIYLIKKRYKISEENKNLLRNTKEYTHRHFIYAREDSTVKDVNYPCY